MQTYAQWYAQMVAQGATKFSTSNNVEYAYNMLGQQIGAWSAY